MISFKFEIFISRCLISYLTDRGDLQYIIQHSGTKIFGKTYINSFIA